MKTNLHVKTREMKANLTMRRRAGILCGLGTTFLLLLIGQSCSAATVTWDGGGDGRSWNDAVNWSNDRVPGVTDNVVLPASTATNVFYRGTQPSPRSLRNNGTLRIAGNGAVGNAALTVSGSLTNFGTIILESSDSSYNETLTVGGILRNNANGVIQVNQGSGGGRYLYANVANEGTLNVTNGTELYCYGAGRTFDQQAGTVNGAGKFVWSDGWFSYAGGSVTGAVYVRDGVLEVAEAAANSSIYCSGNTTLIANWAEGVTVWVQGNSWYGNAILTTSEGAINAGTIRLESAHSSYQSALSIGGFDFLNAPTGVIDVNTGTGGPRSISGHFINQGLVDATDYYVDIFGVYESAGGRTLGNARLQSASVSVTASPDQPTTLDLWGNTTLLTDNLPNTVLWVHGNSGGGSHATLTATGNVTNRGTILLESTGGGYSDTVTVFGTLVNAPEGIIQFNSGSGGPRTINANLLNQGIINVSFNAALNLFSNNASLLNEGIIGVATSAALSVNGTNAALFNRGNINIAANASLYLNGANSVFRQEAGVISATGQFTFADGRFDFVGGNSVGAVHVLNGSLDVAGSAGSSTILCSGNSRLLGNRAPGVTVWIQGNGQYGNATVTTAQGATNAGTIRLESTNAGYNCFIIIGGSNLVNLATGVIDINPGSGGSRSIAGSLVNQGVVDATDSSVDIYGTYEAAGGRILGDGRLRSASVRVTASPLTPTTLDLWGISSLLTDNLPNTVLWVHGGGGSANAALVLPQSATNYGIIRMETTGGGYECRLESSAWLVNAPDGRLEVNNGSGGPRVANLNLLNLSTITVGATLHLTGGATNLVFEQRAGSVAVVGGSVFTWYNGPFRWLAGRLDGAVYSLDGIVEIGADAQASTLRVAGANARLVANRSSLAELWVNGTSYYGQNAALTFLDGAVNLGLLRLESTGGGYSCGIGGAGTLTNGPTGVIESYAGAGGPRFLNGSVFNQGILYVSGPTLVGNSDGQGTNRIFTHAGGRIDCDGFFGWQDGSFLWTGGLVTGLAYVRNGAINVGAGALPSTLHVTGTGSTLLANRSPGVELWVEGNPWWGDHTTLTVASNALNLGRIRLESTGGGYNCTLAGQGTVTNGPTGVIESYPGTGGGRFLNAALDNAGTLRSFTYLASGLAGARHRNSGRIELTGTTLAFTGASLLNTAGGVISGTGTLDVNGLAFTNAGTFSPGSSAGRLTVSGQFRQTTTGRVEFEVGGPGQGSGYDWLEISGGLATLEGGTLVARLINDFVPVVGSRYRVLTASGGLQGQFATLSNLDVHASLDLQPSYLGGALDLVAISAINAITAPTLAASPTSQTIAVGSNAVFLAAANGTAPFQYQWLFNGTAIVGATSNSLRLTNVQLSQAGGYSLRVTNNAGAVTSAVATLTVTSTPNLAWRWNGRGDGFRWSDPRNWEANRVPPAGASVVINVTNNPVIRLDLNLTLASLTCAEALIVQGQSLTLTGGLSSVQGPLALDGSTLTVVGTGASFVASGPANVTNCHFYANAGGRLSISGSAKAILSNFDAVWQANGAGSVLDLSGMTNVFQNGYYTRLGLRASEGGQLVLNRVALADGGNYVTSDGTNSIVDLSGLSGRWSGTGWYYGIVLDARNGGAVRFPNVLEIVGASLTVNSNSNLTLNHLRRISSATITAEGGQPDFSSLTNLDFTTWNVNKGGVLLLSNLVPVVTNMSWSLSEGSRANLTGVRTVVLENYGATWLARGLGALLDLSGVTNVIMTSGSYAYVQAYEGGRVDLRRLRGSSGAFFVTADGTNSVVDFTGLSGRWSSDGSSYTHSLDVRNGGSVLIPNVTEIARANLTVSSNATLITPQLRRLTAATITINGGQPNLGSVIDLNNTTWNVNKGGVLLLSNLAPVVTNMSWVLSEGSRANLTGVRTVVLDSYGATWQARGAGTLLDLSSVTNVIMTSGSYAYVQAYEGGRVDLRRLRSSSGAFFVTADGTNSIVDFTGLSGRWSSDGNSYAHGLDVRNGGSVLIPNVTEIVRANLTVSSNATLITQQLRRLTASTITINGGRPDLSSLTDLNNTTWNVNSGGTLLLSNLGPVITNMSWVLSEGARAELTSVRTVVLDNYGATWQARGQGALLDLSGVTNVIMQPANSYAYVQAFDGGFVDLSGLRQPQGAFLVTADGLASVVDFTGLSGRWSSHGYNNMHSLTAQNDGSIWVPGITEFDRGTIVVRNTGWLMMEQIVRLTRSSVTADFTELDFPDVTAMDGTSLTTVNGGVLRLPALASLVVTNGSTSLSANGVGGLIDLSGVTEIAVAPGYSLAVYAQTGGRVDLGQAAAISDGSVSFYADGVGSVIDLSALIRFNTGSMEVRSGALILTPRLRFLDRVNLTFRGSGRMDTSQIRKLTNSRVHMDATTVDFPALFHWVGTTFTYANGGTVRLPQLDLLLSNVTMGTNQLWSGDRVTVSWQGMNRSGAEVLGIWTDAIYVSVDDRWDIDDMLVGTLDQTNGLTSNTVYSASTAIFVPGVLPGNHHLLVRTVGFNLEGTNGVENTRALPVPISTPELAIGTPTNSAFLQTRHARYWQLITTEGNDLRLTLNLLATNGATELYIRHGAIPTRSVFDAKYSAPFLPDQILRVPGTKMGTNYILAYADMLATEPAPFAIRAEYLPFTLGSISPNHGGNAGNVTLKLSGSAIDTNSTAKLVYRDPQSVLRELQPIRTRRPDTEHIFATFDLRGIAPTTATVALVGGAGQSGTQTNAFRIEPGLPEQLDVSAEGPSAIRRGGAPAKYRVRVQNRSNQDAEFVTLFSWIPNDTNVNLNVRAPRLTVQSVRSSQGFASIAVPELAVGEEAFFDYEVAVGGRYSQESAQISWRAQTTDRAESIPAMAEQVEAARLEVLNRPEIQQSAPEIWALATDVNAWAGSASEQLRKAGFLSDQENLPSSSQAQANAAGFRPASGICDVLGLVCGSVGIWHCAKFPAPPGLFVCGIVYLWVCGGGTLICNNWPPPPPPSPCVVTLPNGTTVSFPDCCGSATPNSAGGVTIQPCTPRPADPNLIEGPGGVGELRFIARETVMPYTIQFENQPSAQAAASEIRIANPLPPELDWTSLQLNDISFGGVHIRVPDGLSHYEGRVPYAGWTWNPSQGWRRGQTPLYVDVAAGIDVTSGLFSVRLTCSDTNTGLLPDDPYAGFLPPNRPELTYSETNGCCGAPTNGTLILPGQGFVSYTIKPKANLATGTRITNAADIYFDFNDLIATPPIFNTIDAGAPASSVLPLPPQNGRTFLVQWVGQDDAGGSGIQSYDVYVSSTGSNYMRWLERTTATSAYFVGELGRTYRFYSFARDWVGHEEAASGTTQAQTTVLTNAPVLQTVSDLSLSVGQPLSFTNTVQGTSVGSLLFTVSSIPQSGAAIGSTNGVLRWTPTCSQGNTTNRITVWVQDTARTNVLDTITFTVTVRQCVLPQLGQLVLETGDSGRVPVHLVTTVPLISLNVPVELPADRFVYPGLEIIVPEICTNSVRLLTNSTYLLSMSTCSNMSLMGTQQVAWLYFTAATNQSSAFVTLQLGQSIGTQPNGTFVTNYIASPGRVVVVGREPLLEAKIETNRQPVLLLYAKPGSNYVIEANADLGMSNGWQPSWQGTMTNLWQTFQNPGGTNRVMFFRARTE